MATFKKALVTGGAGFIGSHLSRALLEQGLEVTILDNLSVGKRENVPDGAEFVRGDILDKEPLREIIQGKGIDIVFHQAAKVSIRDSVNHFYDDAETNLMGTLNILNSLKNSSVKKLVYASSMAVYSDSPSPLPIDEGYVTEPLSPYGVSKLASEKYCAVMSGVLGIDSVVLRYFNTYGKGQGYTPYVGVITIFMNHIRSGKPLTIYGDGTQCRDFIHVSDIVQANIRAMKTDGAKGVFNIGTGVSTSVNRLSEIIRNRMEPDTEVRHLDAQPGELRNSIADISRARDILGFEPLKTLEQAIDDVIS